MQERVARVSLVVALAGLATLAFAIPFVGCDSEWNESDSYPTAAPSGSGSGGGPAGSDGGGGDGGGTDEGGGGQALADGSIPPQGKQLVVGNTFELEGVTSDGFAIYADTAAGTLNAVPISGGSPVKIGATDTGGPAVQVTGPVVFNWTAVNQTTGSATLTIWTSAHASQKLSTSSQAPSGFESAAVSADGTLVAFYDGLSTDGNTANLDVASVDGATPPAVVAAAINIGDAACFPSFAFAGSTILAVYPPPPGDAGAADAAAGGGDGGAAAEYPAIVTAFSGAVWTPTHVATGAYCALALDSLGTEALVSTPAGLSAHTVADPAKAIALDPTGVWGEFAGGADGGTRVVYTDKSAALKTVAAAASATPLVLASSGLRHVTALSPDGAWVLASDVSAAAAAGPVSDLFLASTTTPGTPTSLVATPIAASVGDWFTVDSSHALYAASVASDAGVASNALFAIATGASGTPLRINANVGSVFATSGGKIVFNANDGNGGYDLWGDDTAQASGPTLLVSVADQAFFLSATKDTVVYTWSYTGDAMDGLYAMPAP